MSDPQADDIDDATAELIIMLQQEDLDALEQQKKGKGRADQLSDADLAEQLYIEELQRAGIAFADRRMAQSMARALASDEAVLHEHQDQERAAGEDHEFARRLGGVGGTRVRQQIIAQKQARADSGPGPSLDRVSIALRNGQDNKEVTDGGDSEERSSSGKGAATNKPDDKPMTICGICREQALASEIIELACQHQYCKRCLQQLFVASMTDESMYPPRCCRQPIAFELVKPFLQAEEIELFERKKEEFETANRTYCSSPGCSAFISPKHIENATLDAVVESSSAITAVSRGKNVLVPSGRKRDSLRAQIKMAD
ncbi:hypothetical protein PRK78_003691 [Emydomyces testavorans]|uniref:RING-type domain-containing protein n=1 Tax=Emydomyces testavorans TaxID=2070801 RepID=A0AAF0DHB0_9EURO|nr:hypothetical protein PRK78_003691 [Emydomyces testavorans]